MVSAHIARKSSATASPQAEACAAPWAALGGEGEGIHRPVWRWLSHHGCPAEHQSPLGRRDLYRYAAGPPCGASGRSGRETRPPSPRFSSGSTTERCAPAALRPRSLHTSLPVATPPAASSAGSAQVPSSPAALDAEIDVRNRPIDRRDDGFLPATPLRVCANSLAATI